MKRRWVSAVVASLIAAAAQACSREPTAPSFSAVIPATFVGAGDIAECSSPGAAQTAALLDQITGTIFTAGDNAYYSGSAEEYATCYDPSWGRLRSRTRPTPGNHEYESPGAVPYFNYFGDRAGAAGLGYYSYDVGAWHVVSLNSNVPADVGSAQLAWLRADLAASSTTCTLAYWHHPVFSTGIHGNDPTMREVWRVLEVAHADVVITGHDHDYERFAPMTAEGVADAQRGIRSFVVGTGGHPELRGFVTTDPSSEVRNSSTWGVLKLTLRPADYDWEFIPVAGGSFRDAGSGACVR